MSRRINVLLPNETVETVDRIAKPGNRSRFIDNAIKFYIKNTARARLRERLKEGAIRNSQRDLEIAGDWLAVDQEQWRKLQESEESTDPIRSVAKSTSRRSTRQ